MRAARCFKHPERMQVTRLRSRNVLGRAGTMRKAYRSLCISGLQTALAYRGSFLVNLVAHLFLIVSLLYVWKAIYATQNSLAGYTWEDMKAYLLVTTVANGLVSWYTETAMSSKILDG